LVSYPLTLDGIDAASIGLPSFVVLSGSGH
jgi:hypothetical protein